MAVKLNKIRPLNAVTLYSRVDDAIDNEASDWGRYAEDPIANVDALVFLPDVKPTKFICNFEFSGKDDAAIKDAMMKGVDADNEVRMSMGTWQYELVRRSLKIIENPSDVDGCIQLKKESGQFVDKNTMSILSQAGVVGEIFQACLTLRGNQDEEKQNAKN